MGRRRLLGAWSCGALSLLAVAAAGAQDYPVKPVRAYASEIGGSTDFAIRLIAPAVSSALGQPLVIENRPSNILGEFMLKLPPDGYSFLVAGGTFVTVTLIQKMPYDPVRDFAPVTMMTRAPDVVMVHPSLPVKSVKELIALAKARPGELNYGAGPAGGGPHLAAEMFKSMAGINIAYVRYKGTGPALTALVSGEVQMVIFTPVSVMPLLKSGRIKGLAVASEKPSVLFPGTPTVAASGLPGFESSSGTGIFVPARTPPAAVNRLNQEIVRALNRPDVKEKFLNTATEVVANSPDEFGAYVKSVVARVGRLIKDANIKAE
jgi:tripartite-type tricarboxylate transporter receptor subunit TctC